MGQAIHYCYRCSTQLRDVQFEQGKAFRIDARVCCSDCAPEAVRTLPPELVRQLLTQLAAKPARPAAPPPVLRSATPRQPVPAARPRPAAQAQLWIGVGIAAAILVTFIIMVAFSESHDAPAPPEPEKAASKGVEPKTSTVPPADGPARQALAVARTFAREHPDDLFAQLGKFEDLTLQADKTEVGAEARKEAASLRSRGKEAVDRALKALEQEISAPLGRESFAAVLDILESAKARMEWPDWKLAVDRRAGEVRDRTKELYEPLKAKAMEAKAKGDAAALDAVVARVRGWGVRGRIDDLNEALGGVALPPVRIVLQDFEGEPKGWGFVGGQEFPGAKGSVAIDSTVSHGGRRAYKLQADFSGGGAYVGLWCDLTSFKERDIQEIRLWVKTSSISRLGIRLSDDSDQCHQKNGGVALSPSTEWQEVVLKVRDLVGGEHWGGANDGRWHGPARGFGINVGKGTFTSPAAKQGVIWIDDVEVIAIPSAGR